MDMEEARRQLTNLKQTLKELAEKDADQEVRGIAVPVLDTVITEVRKLLPDNAVVQSVREVISPDAIGAGEDVGVADALVVVTALESALPPRPRVAPKVVRRPDSDNWRTRRF